MYYENPTYIQKGMIADHPDTPLIVQNQLYNEINFETNIEFRKIEMVKMLLGDTLDSRTKELIWLDLKKLMNDLSQADLLKQGINTLRRQK